MDVPRHRPATPYADPKRLLTVRIFHRPMVVRIELEGELDSLTVQLFTDAIAQVARTDAEQVEVCMRGLRFMGARGLHALLTAREVVLAQGRRFTITAVSPVTQRVLDITGTAAELGLE